MKEGDGLALASCARQRQAFDIRLAVSVVGRARFQRRIVLIYGMQVKHVGDDRVVGGVVLHFKPSALVWWGAENG